MTFRRFRIALVIFALLSPLGLLATGDAWGEWSAETLESMIGYVPAGLARFGDIWQAPFPDYSISGTPEFLGYILSAVCGMLFTGVAAWGAGKLLARRAHRAGGHRVDS